MKKSITAYQKNVGWKSVQLEDDITKLQKTWSRENKVYRVNAYFGKLRDGMSTPVIIMNVYERGFNVKHVFDNNYDVWENIFTPTNKDESNEYYKYLRKHGFEVCRN